MRTEFMVIPDGREPVLRVDTATGVLREAGTAVEGSILGWTATGMPRVPEAGGRTICWSGSYAECTGGGLFDDDPRTWGPKGWAALEAAMRASGDGFRGRLIRTHARHVLSDMPSIRRFAQAEWGGGASLLVDPASMLTPAMLTGGRVADHLTRIFEDTATIEPGRIGAVLICGAEIVDAMVWPCALARGVSPAALVIRLASILPRETPLAVWHERWEEDVQSLAAAAAIGADGRTESVATRPIL